MPAPEDPPPTDPIHLSFQYTQRDWLDAVTANSGSKPAFDAFFTAAAIAAGLYIWNNPQFGDIHIFFFAIAAIFAFIRFLLPRLIFSTSKRFHQPYDLIFTPDAIDFRTTGIISRLQWSTYTRALITPKVILLYYENRHFTTIPQRVFKTEEERSRFDKLITEKIPSIKRRTR